MITSSCKKESACWHSYGKESVTPIRVDLENFDSFLLDGNDVFINLISDSVNYIEIIGGENSSRHINYKIENNKLIITNNNKCDWLRNRDNRLKINLHFKKLIDIKNAGDGSINSPEAITFDSVFIHQNGTGNINLAINANRIWLDMYVIGDINLNGNCETLIATIASFGNLKAKDLKANDIDVKTIHEGDAHVNPQKSLKAVCEEIGDIYYYNKVDNPIITESEEGKVEFIEE